GRGRGGHPGPGGLAAVQRGQGGGVQPRRPQRTRRLDHGGGGEEGGGGGGRDPRQEPHLGGPRRDGALPARPAGRGRRRGVRPQRADQDALPDRAGQQRVLPDRAAVERASRGAAEGGEAAPGGRQGGRGPAGAPPPGDGGGGGPG